MTVDLLATFFGLAIGAGFCWVASLAGRSRP